MNNVITIGWSQSDHIKQLLFSLHIQSASRILVSQISLYWINFRLEPIDATAPAASKTMLDLKEVKSNSKLIISLR
jgi:hypothetical protein